MKRISAILLAAGFSSRMGALKPLLPVGDTSALLRAIGVLQDAGAARISVVTGYRHGEVAAEASLSGARVVYNERFADGMLSSVQAGVSSLPSDTDGFFLLPADCCAVGSGVLRRLTAEFDGAHILYPVCNGRRGHPPLVPYSAAEPLLRYTGEDGARGCLAQFPARDIETGDGTVLLDMDTPEGYAQLLRALNL
ncbi:MAG: nucleotidyltransferase family protein [Oscillospiraceae bacterium]|nr:nucleotidyltransferase family protein [Oscillospiraceae bacterium]